MISVLARMFNVALILLPLGALGVTAGALIANSPRAFEFAIFTVASTVVVAYYEWTGR